MNKVAPLLIATLLLGVVLVGALSKRPIVKVEQPEPEPPEMYEIIKVIEGDVLLVMYEEKVTAIRLFGIDSPERGAPFSESARLFLKEQSGSEIHLVVYGEDQFERTIAEVFNQGENSVNVMLVRQGLAWCYDTNTEMDAICKKALKEAQKQKIGLWAEEPEPEKAPESELVPF